jgi:hypothetical protein
VVYYKDNAGVKEQCTDDDFSRIDFLDDIDYWIYTEGSGYS